MRPWPDPDWATGYVSVLWHKRHWKDPTLRQLLRHWVKVARANRRP